MRFSWAVTYRLASIVVVGALAAVAFRQGRQGWDIVGAVLAGAAIADAILLVAVARFHWNRRPGGRHDETRREGR